MLLAIGYANKPVIAAMHGAALGGGFELALTANYRIAVPSAKFGLPEIKLGLIPGAGGTQLLPRLVGVERALDLVLSGTTFSARDARDWGVVDELAEEGHLLDGAIAFARKLIDAAAPLRRVRDLTSNIEAARARPDIFDAIREANARRGGLVGWLWPTPRAPLRSNGRSWRKPWRPDHWIEKPKILDLVVPGFDRLVAETGATISPADRPILPLSLRSTLLAGVAILERSGPNSIAQLHSRTIGPHHAYFGKIVAGIVTTNKPDS